MFSSCAFHKKFPFICFRSGCVKVAFGVYKIKAWKKNRQGKANVRRSKANSKASLKKKKQNKTTDSNYNPNDTLTYSSKGIKSNCNQLSIIFFKKNGFKKEKRDTLTINFDKDTKEITDLDKVQINIYLNKNTKTDIIKIKLSDCDQKNKSDYSRSLYLDRSGKTSDYFKSKGIMRRKIELE